MSESRRNQDMPGCALGKVGEQVVWLVRIVEHEQPTVVSFKPIANRGDDDLLVGKFAHWQIEFLSEQAVRGGKA